MNKPPGTAAPETRPHTQSPASDQNSASASTSLTPPKEQLSEQDALLIRAAHLGSKELLETALSQGARVSVAEPGTGLTALHIAVGTNNLVLVRYLIEEWKAPFGPDRFGRWPTVVAAECYASEELCDYIVEQEAKFTPPSK